MVAIDVQKLLVTFDLDGVLMVNPFGRGVFPEVRRRLAPYVTHEQAGDQGAEAFLKQRIRAKAAELTQRGAWRAAYDWDQIIADIALELGASETFDIAAMVRSYCSLDYISRYQDAQSALVWLKGVGATLAWVSNGYAIYQQPVLDALGLSGYFHTYAAPDLVGSVKPEPEIFRSVKPAGAQLCIHVGDMLAHDVVGAKRAGFVPVWLDRELPEALRQVPVIERTSQELTVSYLAERLKSEFCWEAYRLELPNDILPSYIICTLDELRCVVDDLDHTLRPSG